MRHSNRQIQLITAAVLAAIVVMSPRSTSGQTPSEPPDKYQWLEDVSGDRSMAWVRAENQRTAKVIESDPRFADLQATALKVVESPDRLAIPAINGDQVYNTWRDADHIRGIFRRTSLTDYLTAQPHWQTVLDYDALAKQDNQKWVQKGRVCLYPGNELCLVALSAGGEDALTLREFNLASGKFVEGGFQLARSKQIVAWVDKDTLLVSRDWGPGTMTKSGYPFVVKLWKRGQPLDQAKEVFRGAETDAVAAAAGTLHDGDGHQVTLFRRAPSFFEREVSLLTPDGPKRIALPAKSSIDGLIRGQLIVSLDEDWKPEGGDAKFVQGSVISLALDDVKADSVHLNPAVVFAPTSTECAEGVSTTRNRLLLTTLRNVQGRVYSYTFDAKGAWTEKKLDVPDNQTVSVISTNWSDDRFFLSLDGFLTPPSLLLGDAAAGTL